MSFVNILKKFVGVLGTAATVEHEIAPFLKYIPGIGPAIAVVDPIITNLQNSIITAEANNPVDGQGQLKSQAVTNNFTADLATFNAFAEAAGYTATFDSAALQETINNFVAAYNSAAKLKSTIKLAPKTA